MRAWRSLAVRMLRGSGAVEQMRLLFAVFAIVNLFVQIPQILTTHSRPVPLIVTFLAAVGLISIWGYGLRRRAFPGWTIMVELVCLVLFGLNLGQPSALLTAVYGAMYLRCLSGTHAGAVIRVLGYVTALEIVAYFHDPSDRMQRPDVMWAWVLPSFAITSVVLRTLAVSLERLTAARDLSTRLANTARELLAANSPAAVRSLVESCVLGVAPGASLVKLEIAGDPQIRTGRHMAVFALHEDGRSHGRLIVAPASSLSAQQREVLQTLAAQATAAIEATALRAMLSHRANHDGLTGLPNRTLFQEVLVRALSHRGPPVAVLFIDIDDFKVVNDSLGHSAGDQLLIEVADRLHRCIRSGDIAARMGGDEFAVSLDGVDGDEAAVIAKQILAALESPFRLDGRMFNLHCSVGIAQAAPVPERASELAVALVRDADMAMYVAKTRGKNRYERFSVSMAEAVMHDRRTRDQLSGALARGELELFFQPIVALADGSVVTVESLVRWRHPQRGLLSPADFLPQAERVGLMPDIERWVIAAACQTAATWAGACPPAVAVNISPQHLARTWLVPVIRQALAQSGLPGERLVLEITEEFAVLEPAAAAANLRECVALGVRVAMDDFGAGHASLKHIGALPITTVKLDRSLVAQQTGPVVIRAVVDLAHTLGLQVVAEGVEEPEQLAWLRDCECDAVQGFLLARPVPEHELRLHPLPTTATAAG